MDAIAGDACHGTGSIPGEDRGDARLDVPDNGAWYVLRCKPRGDARLMEHLGNQGFEAFSPSCLATRRTGNVRRKVTEPMFPGYLFVRLRALTQDWSVLRSTRGVQHVVRFGSHAPQVPQSLIDRLCGLDGFELE